MGISIWGVSIVFKIVDCEPLPENQFRMVIETDDSSLFTSLSFLDSLIEFTGSFRYQANIALKIKNSELTKDVRAVAAAADRAMILELFESTAGENPRQRMNTVLRELQDAGRDWMRLDGVIAILKIARSERKESIQKNMAREQKKSA
jgi:hypothetical protein